MKRGVWILKFMIMGLLCVAVIGLVTQALWNWLVPDLFGGHIITYWQALGLLLLSKIFLWTFNKGAHRNHRAGWGYYWSQKWKGMSPEERERLKEKMKEKWCYPDRNKSTGDQDTTKA
jgi:hypothetical protein